MHVGIIMDGNRRWAESKGMPRFSGHKEGAETLKKIIRSCENLGIKTLTLYALSTENLKRSKEEVDSLMELFQSYISELLSMKEVDEKDVRIRFIGNLSLLSQDLQHQISELMEKTKDKSTYTVNFCVAYGGREELLHAVNEAVKKGEEVTEDSFNSLLYLEESPDLIIRTGGAVRTSNFLPWQSIYSEWFFVETFWPAFTEDDLKSILEDFSKRKRNFGK